MNAKDLEAGLRVWAANDPHSEAAVDLLAAHDVWLHRADFTAAAIDPAGPDFARIQWVKAFEFAVGDVNAPTSALAVLNMAILIGQDMYRLASLDRTNRGLVVRALTHALRVPRG
jgi:hypothetical protein